MGEATTRMLVAGEEIGGCFAIVEVCQRRDTAPPRHIHTREDEVVYVLEGRVTFRTGAQRRDCPAGSCLFLPRGGEYSLTVETGEVRLLCLFIPAGFEGYYREQGIPTGGADGWGDAERLVTAAARYGV